jgi:hypothetical protein
MNLATNQRAQRRDRTNVRMCHLDHLLQLPWAHRRRVPPTEAARPKLSLKDDVDCAASKASWCPSYDRLRANAARAETLRGWDPLTFPASFPTNRVNPRAAPAAANDVAGLRFVSSAGYPADRHSKLHILNGNAPGATPDDGPRRKHVIQGVSVGLRRTRVTDSIREMLDPVTNANT